MLESIELTCIFNINYCTYVEQIYLQTDLLEI